MRYLGSVAVWAGLALVALAACSDDERAKLGELCDTVACDADLYCSLAGDLRKRCTADCAEDAFCQSHFGAAICFEDRLCARVCVSDAQCESGYCASLSDGSSVCLSGTRPSPMNTAGAGGRPSAGAGAPNVAGSSMSGSGGTSGGDAGGAGGDDGSAGEAGGGGAG